MRVNIALLVLPANLKPNTEAAQKYNTGGNKRKMELAETFEKTNFFGKFLLQ